MNYFKDCECQETAKEKYRSLAKKLHPDRGGSAEEMAELTKQYEDFKKFGSDIESLYRQAFKKYDDVFNSSGSTRFRRFEQAEEKVTDYTKPGQTAGWRTNKPKTRFEGYGDIPFDHPIRQELFQLRNRLAACDNTYKRPRTNQEENEINNLKNQISLLIQNNSLLREEKEELQKKIKEMWNEEDVQDLKKQVIESEKLKFENMSFFAKISYLFFPR